MMRPAALIYLLAIAATFQMSAKVTLPPIISDGMLLSAGKASLWGSAKPSSQVVIKPSWTDKVTKTTAGSDGSWNVEISTGPQSSSPSSISFTDGEETVTVSDVLVGEVWLCSGQSNMVFPVGDHTSTLSWQTGMEDADLQLQDALYPEIRLFMVDYAISPDKPIETCSGKWVKCTPETAFNFSAVSFIFGRTLHRALGCPVGLIQSAVGATSIESWINPDLFKGNKIYDYALKRWSPERVNEKNAHRIPGGLYNAMIYPIKRYTVDGIIWYQGEGNAINAETYEEMLTTMIESWRSDRNNLTLPFGMVQIAPFHNRSPYVREAQFNVMKRDPETIGMVVTTDVGDSLDIHPRNKTVPGMRLARWALAKVYGRNIEYSGPVFKNMTIDGDSAVLTFDHCDGLRSSDGSRLTGFMMQDRSGSYHVADARIDGDHVVVKAAGVSQPVNVRYGFENFPRVNLVNRSGLPATPFRTDQIAKVAGKM